MVTYIATLDVPRHVVEYLARLLALHRRRIGTPKGARALGPFRQAVLVLRWFRERGCVHCLARDAGVSQATGYRYLHEGIDVLADQAPDLHAVLDRCRAEGMTHLVLDGTLIACDRVAGVRENGNDLWFSQKHKSFGGNIQFLSAPDGTPLWISDVEPGSTPDITAARLHVLPALYKAAADGLPTLADKGYIGAGIGIRVPVRRPKGRSEKALDIDTRTTNALIRHVRAFEGRQRATIVLLAARGRSNAWIAAQTRMHVDTVRTWRGRFAAGGLPALADRRRSGRPVSFTPLQVAEVKALACQLPAETGAPLSRWSCPELAREVVARSIAGSISPSTVRR